MSCQNQSDSIGLPNASVHGVAVEGGGSVRSAGRGGQLSISYQWESNISITQIGPVVRHRPPQIALINTEQRSGRYQIPQIPGWRCHFPVSEVLLITLSALCLDLSASSVG